MNFDDLSNDAKELFEKLPQSGRIQNQTGMTITGWDFEKLRKAKFELRDAGFIDIKASFGGPFGRLQKNDTANKDMKESNEQVFSDSESQLYEPFKKWAEEEFLPDNFIKGRDIFEVVISANKRPSGSRKWEIPDIISISLKKYKYIPDLEFKTISFEIKPRSAAFDVYGIFEAISHSKFGNLTYYCFEYQNGDELYDNKEYQRIEQESKSHGIGLIQIWFKDHQKTIIEGEIILEAKPMKYDPATLSDFIERFIPDEIKNAIISRTNSW
jgi:hypothetical protein